jgi:hypothetical protein
MRGAYVMTIVTSRVFRYRGEPQYVLPTKTKRESQMATKKKAKKKAKRTAKKPAKKMVKKPARKTAKKRARATQPPPTGTIGNVRG